MSRNDQRPVIRNIDWRSSESKELVLNDLRTGVLGLTEEETSTDEAWEYYRNTVEFVREGVGFPQFSARLADHRAQVGARVGRAQWDAASMHLDRSKHPYPSHNARGEPNFHLSPAETLLRQDVRAGLHLGLTPSHFQATRPEYSIFKKKKFKLKQRVYTLDMSC